MEVSPASHRETGPVQITDSSAARHKLGFYHARLGYKYLPRKYRESQSDWYGKRGICCHISVAVRRRNDHLKSQGLIHVIQNCSQGSCAVVVIMAHILKTLKQENPEIQRAFFRQDNAGCYHSAATVLTVPTIVQESGIQVVELGFSDPQRGKVPADRMAATIKGHLNRFVNEVTTSLTPKKWGKPFAPMEESQVCG